MQNVRTLYTFLRVVKWGNFSRAARELDITPQAVSLHIKQLEESVGVRLFNRSTRQVTLTEEGARFYKTCSAALESIEEEAEELRNASEDVFGLVRVAAPHGLSRRYVVPAISRFLNMYPRVSIDLMVQNKVPDVISDGIDVGILADPLPDSSLVARKVATASFIHCASPDYLQRHGVPHKVEDLDAHHCINLRNWMNGRVLRWKFRDGDDIMTHTAQARLTIDDGDNVLEAVLAGAGIAQLASYRAAPYIRSKELVPVLKDTVTGNFSFYVYMQRRTQIPKKNRVLADYLYEELRTHPDLKEL